MKKIFNKVILIIFIVAACLLFNAGVSNAASATITSTSKEVNVGDSVSINVSVDAIAWNLKVSGSGISETVVGGNMDGDELANKKTNKTYKLDTSKAGTYTVQLSGDVTDANGTPSDISSSVTIKVNEKVDPPAQDPTPTPSTPTTTTPTPTPDPDPVPQKPTEPTFKNVNETVYVNQKTVNVRETYSGTAKLITSLKKGDSVTRTGVSTETIDGYVWSRITYNGKTAYVISSALTTTKVEVKEDEEDDEEKSTNKSLKELIVKGYKLTPEFNSQTTKYNLTLNETDEILDITATPEDEKATVNITGNESFKVGNNIVKITVTAEDGTARIYTITVSKNNEEGVVDSLKLASLQISNATLEPEFDPNITNYILTVEDPSTITAQSILATVNDKNITITTSETTLDENGEKVITLMLESQKEEKTGIYQITVKKPVVNEMAPTMLANTSDNTIFYILGGIIGALLILIIIIIIALKKTSSKDDYDDIRDIDELSDDYDYNLKGAIDEANKPYDEMVEESNFKTQILNKDLGISDETKVMNKFESQYNQEDDFRPNVTPKKKGKHF